MSREPRIVTSRLPCLSVSPSTNSRLGEIGFIDTKESWQRVVNICDEKECKELGIEPIALRKPSKDLIVRPTTDVRSPQFEDPFVFLEPAGTYDLIRSANKEK
jgi:hypothetical protein